MIRASILLPLLFSSLAMAAQRPPVPVVRPNTVNVGSPELRNGLRKLIRKHLRKAKWSVWWFRKKFDDANRELAIAERLAAFEPMPDVLAQIKTVRAKVEAKQKRYKTKPKGKE